MAFVTSLFLIDAPASALNNSGESIPGARTDNTSSVKFIRTLKGETYPYVSAQAFRYWLRDTLDSSSDIEWHKSPVYREEKIAYTDANPIEYWDDDLLGYMRAPSKKKKDVTSTDDPELKRITDLQDEKGGTMTVTRVAPFRVSTLVSLAPVNITSDFGTMTREGDPVPYEHQFYRAVLVGSTSLNLSLAGRFHYMRRTGFQNLDTVRTKLANEKGLMHLPEQRAFVLPTHERLKRITSLLRGLGRLQGGAKQAIHYTDVNPVVVITAVIRGGGNPFQYVFKHQQGIPSLDIEALSHVYDDLRQNNLLICPDVFIGWKPGYLPEERKKLGEIAITPNQALENIADWLNKNPDALDI